MARCVAQDRSFAQSVFWDSQSAGKLFIVVASRTEEAMLESQIFQKTEKDSDFSDGSGREVSRRQTTAIGAGAHPPLKHDVN